VNAVARGQEIDLDKQRDVVEHRRNNGGQCDARIGNLQILGDQECCRAHNRRHDLTAGRRNRFDRSRDRRRIASPFHHRDGESAIDDDICHGAAADIAEQAG